MERLLTSAARIGRALVQAVIGFLFYPRVPKLPAVPQNEGTSLNIDSLPQLVVNGNWNLPSSKLPHWLVHNAGLEMENLATGLIDAVGREMGNGSAPFLAGEMQNKRGVHRPLRFLHRFQPGHVSTTDVVLRAEGNDLYVRFLTQPRTRLTYLRYAWWVSLFLVGFFLLFFAYLTITGARKSWASDYAQKHAPRYYPGQDKMAFLTRRILEGYYSVNWGKLRQKLRGEPQFLLQVKSELSAVVENVDKERATKDQSWVANGQEAALLKIKIVMLGELEEYAPDTLAERILKQRSQDEFACMVTGDDYRPNGMAVARVLGDALFGWADTHPLALSDQLREVDLGSTFTSLLEGRPELRKEMLRLYESCTRREGPWSYSRLLREDPHIALMNFGMPAAILAAVVGFFAWRSPKSWLRHPCRLLGWIKPDDFDSEAIARNGHVVRLFSSTLLEAGFPRDAITELGGGEG